MIGSGQGWLAQAVRSRAFRARLPTSWFGDHATGLRATGLRFRDFYPSLFADILAALD